MIKDPKDKFKSWLNETWYIADESERQKIVDHNVALLIDRDAWSNHVASFETFVPEENRQFYTVHFDRAKIDHGNFERYRFPCSVSFSGAKFSAENVRFNNAIFAGGGVYFAEVKFGTGLVSFTSAQFGNGDVSFRKAVFKSQRVEFSSAIFGEGTVNFGEAKFGDGNVTFGNVDFGVGDVSFVLANFGAGGVNFNSCEVAGRFLFRGNFRPLESEISGWFSMGAVQFPELVDFSGRTFKYAPNFVSTTFKIPPDLSQVIVGPPKMFGDRGLASFKKVERSQDAARYRKLKAMAIATNDHEKELEFFAHELRCKRGHETTGWASILNSLFELTSNYGQSIWRPIKGLAFTFLLFFFSYFWIGKEVDDAFLASFYASLPFLRVLNDSGVDSCVDCAFDPGVLLVPLQMLFSLAFLFLLFLGLRNRFKIK